MATSTSRLPVELYRDIAVHLEEKDDLIELSVVNRAWRAEAEKLLWHIVSLTYDGDDEENIGRLRYLAAHTGQYVQHLELDYCHNAYRLPEEYNGTDGSFRLVSKAISRMCNLESVDILCHGDMAARLFAASQSSFSSVRTVNYVGSCSPPLYAFLHSCAALQSLRFSNNLEPLGDYTILHQPWTSLVSFSGNIYHVAAMLRSRLPIEELTIHLNPEASIRSGFQNLPKILSVKSLGIGDLHGYTPIRHAHVLDDLKEAISFFPNLVRIRRAPFMAMNRQELLRVLAKSTQLREVSILDYSPKFDSKRIESFATELISDWCRRVDRVIAISCPPPRHPVAHDYRWGLDGVWSSSELNIREDSDI